MTAERRGDAVRILVADEGPGIPAEKQSEVFGRFSQLESDDARVRGGSGLGLAIAHGIVEQHGGSIWIEESSAKGSVFAVELPLMFAAEPAEQADDVSVLIVEDDADLASVLAATLEQNGERPEAVRSVAAALDSLAGNRPELIVLDLNLPDAHGRGVISSLRSEGRLDDVALVVYTAQDLSEAELRELGPDAEVVTKSRVSAAEFEQVMLEALARQRTRKAPPA